MLLGMLEVTDFATIVILFACFAALSRVSSRYQAPTTQAQLRRLELKLDAVMKHLGMEYIPPPKAAWQELADDPTRKIPAIKAYREEHGVGLAEAKRVVEDYMAGR
jgi:hypothetical protein